MLTSPQAMHHRNGISLTEVVLSIPLVGLLLVGAMTSVGAVLETWNQSSTDYDSLGLAQDLMGEILQRSYEDPGGAPQFGPEIDESGSVRKKYDDVDDYHGWSQTPPEDARNMTLNDHDGWTRAVNVALVKVSDPTQTTATDEGLKRIVVAVTAPSGGTTELTAFRSKWGVLEAESAADATVQCYVNHDLHYNDRHTYTGTVLRNHAE